MSHLITLVEGLRDRGIGFRSLQEGAIDTTTASGELIFNIFSALAQFERRLIQERTRAGLAVARARGRCGGRPRIALEEAKVLAARKLAHDTTLSIDDVCRAVCLVPCYWRLHDDCCSWRIGRQEEMDSERKTRERLVSTHRIWTELAVGHAR